MPRYSAPLEWIDCWSLARLGLEPLSVTRCRDLWSSRLGGAKVPLYYRPHLATRWYSISNLLLFLSSTLTMACGQSPKSQSRQFHSQTWKDACFLSKRACSNWIKAFPVDVADITATFVSEKKLQADYHSRRAILITNSGQLQKFESLHGSYNKSAKWRCFERLGLVSSASGESACFRWTSSKTECRLIR